LHSYYLSRTPAESISIMLEGYNKLISLGPGTGWHYTYALKRNWNKTETKPKKIVSCQQTTAEVIIWVVLQAKGTPTKCIRELHWVPVSFTYPGGMDGWVGL